MKNKKIIAIIVVTSVILLIFAGVFGSIVWFNNQIKPVNSESDEYKEIEITSGTTTTKIIAKLEEEDLIRNELAAKIFIKLNNVTNLQAGKYNLSPSMDLEQILGTMAKGNVVKDEIKITFLEGKNMRWIAKKIEAETSNKAEDVYKKLEDKEYISKLIDQYWFLTDEIKNQDIYYPLEGYLYPETYTFKNKDVTIEEIFKVLLDETDKILTKYKSYIENKKYSIHQMLTMASIVELEGNDVESRRGIARVIFNRLSKKMSLGSDVTTYYGIKVDMGERNLYSKEINTYNPYNTRGPNMEGKLPVGPISTVSEESIKSVLEPTQNDYLYFVADMKGKIYFSSTYAEHQEIINKLKRQGLWYEYK